MTVDTATLNSEQITRGSGSNFVSAFWFLPEEKRRALTAIYAYCRLTDDIVDLADGSGRGDARGDLERWEKDTLSVLTGNSQGGVPVLRELGDVARKFSIPADYFRRLVEGVRMDIDRKTYATFEDLYAYCYRVAGVVGLMCLEVFGYRDPRSKEYAVNLGVAFQITNILRDVRTDAERGRVYIPEEDLKKCGLSRDNILTHPNSPMKQPEEIKRFKALVDLECARAEHYYAKSRENLVPEDRPNLVSAEVMKTIYYSILRKIKKRPLSVFESKVRLSKSEIWARVLQGWATNRLAL